MVLEYPVESWDVRHLLLEPERIAMLDGATTFRRWQQILLDGGLLFELPDPLPAELEPLAEVQDRLTVLRALEERISRFRGPNPFHTGAVPKQIYAFGALVLLGLCGGFNWFIALYHGVVFLGACALACCALFAAVQLHRKKELRRMEALQKECQTRLREQTARVLATPMNLKVGGLQITNTPHRNWLKHRIRELKQVHGSPALIRELRGLAEHLREGETLELAPLRARLEHEPTLGHALDKLLE